jgi:hypothetical protein
MLLFKRDRRAGPDLVIQPVRDDDPAETIRIRCPQCNWQPSPSSRWSCVSTGHPEHFNAGCGTAWNTFDTRGRCPGCSHRWEWTICLACAQWSRHDDWYEEHKP